MTLREYYTLAMALKLESLCLFIEYLIIEQHVLSWESNETELYAWTKRCFSPKNEKRMTKLLLDYREGIK